MVLKELIKLIDRSTSYLLGKPAAHAASIPLSVAAGDFDHRQLLLENTIFQMNLRKSVSLKEIADHLLTGIADLYPGAIGSILLLNDDDCLEHFSAPSLPQGYIDAINLTRPGLAVGSCGTTAATGNTVIVENIETDLLWKDYRHLALSYGLKACWSVPIPHPQKPVLGTFAIYHAEAKAPGAAMLHFIQRWAQIVGMLFEYRHAWSQAQKMEERYRDLFEANPLPMWIFDPETFRFLQVNATAIQQYGYSQEEFRSMTVFDLRPEEDHPKLQAILNTNKTGNRTYARGHWKHRKKNGEMVRVEIFSHTINYNGREAMLVLANDVTRSIELQDQLDRERSEREQTVLRATVEMQEKARKDIANELHDNVNQLLGAAKLYLETGVPGEPLQEEYRQESRAIIDTAIEEIRKLSRSLTPPMLSEAGLIAAIEALIQRLRKLQPFGIHFRHEGIACRNLDNAFQLAIYRILQEQTNNIIKYAGATEVTIDLHAEAHRLRLEISDNGAGFDTSVSEKGVGFINIANRVSVYHGNLHIQSSPGNGCSLHITLQIPGTQA